MSIAHDIKEIPVLFAGYLVRAIRKGRKTQTRRPIKGDNLEWHNESDGPFVFSHARKDCDGCEYGCGGKSLECPYGNAGDRLWVRENFWVYPKAITARLLRDGADTWPEIVYDADVDDSERDEWRERGWIRRPSIHMRRDQCRLILQNVSVRVEEVQSITEEQAAANGAFELDAATPAAKQMKARWYFRQSWDSFYAAAGFGWRRNPPVWIVNFLLLSDQSSNANCA